MSRTVTADDGVDIAVHEFGEGDDRPRVMLQHGFAASSRTNWVLPGVVDALVAAGRRVVAVDARGHGESAKPHDASAYGEARMARDLSTVIDAIGATEVDLVG